MSCETNYRRRNRLIRLCESQNWRCCYCGVRLDISANDGPSDPDNMATRDHVVPRSETRSLPHKVKIKICQDNLVASCCKCNKLRGDMNAIDFFILRQFQLREEARKAAGGT